MSALEEPQQLELVEQPCKRGHANWRFNGWGRRVCRDCENAARNKRRAARGRQEKPKLRVVPASVVVDEGEGVLVDTGERYSLADWKRAFPATWARISAGALEADAWGARWDDA